jgi:CelD/BcsL family acetyltransferase involved in cellulose biosynthesis
MIGANASSRAAFDGMAGGHRPDVIAVPRTTPGTALNEPQIVDWKPGLRGEVLGREALPMLLPAWEDLCGRSVEDNVYYSPRYAHALLESVESDRNVDFAVVWDEMRLVALLPFTSPKFAIPLLQPAGRAWQSKYTFSCMPLLDELRKTEAAGVLLDALASVGAGEWIFPSVNTKGEACQAMIAALERSGLPWIFLNPFQRAILEAGSTFDEHMQRHVSSNRRKGLARNRRRLEELGNVEHESHGFGEGLGRAVSAFLKIEASGWKGKRGTALACDQNTRKFAINAFTGEEANSICRADVLTLNGAPIAVSLITLAGRTGFAVKASYDESYRSYAPGLLLETEVIRSFLSGNWASRLDSATAGTHVIDSLWPGRIEVADLMFSLSPRYPQLRLSALRISDQTRSTIRSGIIQCLTRLRLS